MTVLQAIAYLIENRWQRDHPDRTNSLPSMNNGVTVIIEEESGNERLRQKDVLKVADDGDQDFEPQGFGHTHDSVDARVRVECRTTDRNGMGSLDGRIRCFGGRDPGTLEAEGYGGLVGEVERVVDDVRSGVAEFNRVYVDRITDESATSGKGHYRGDVHIALVEHARKNNPNA
jgi:hypothetical protein